MPSSTGVTDKSRVSRAIFLLQAARNAGDVGLKSAFYCICFEALYSTAVTEVNHRVSERVASFLGTKGEERRAIYKDVHDLYNVRSPVLHGSAIKGGKLPAFLDLLRRCDDHLRRCFRRILDEPSMLDLFTKGDDARITTHFLDQLFLNNQP